MSRFASPMRILHSVRREQFAEAAASPVSPRNLLISPKTAKNKFGLAGRPAWRNLAPGLEKSAENLAAVFLSDIARAPYAAAAVSITAATTDAADEPPAAANRNGLDRNKYSANGRSGRRFALMSLNPFNACQKCGLCDRPYPQLRARRRFSCAPARHVTLPR